MKTYTPKEVLKLDNSLLNTGIESFDSIAYDTFGAYLKALYKHDVNSRKFAYFIKIASLVFFLYIGVFCGHWRALVIYLLLILAIRLYTVRMFKKVYDNQKNGLYFRFSPSGISMMAGKESYGFDSWQMVEKLTVLSNGIVVEMNKKAEMGFISTTSENPEETAGKLLNFWRNALNSESKLDSISASGTQPSAKDSTDEISEEESIVISILKNMGCEVSVLGKCKSSYIEIDKDFLGHAAAQKQRGYTNILVLMDKIFVDTILEEYEPHSADLLSYVNSKLAEPYIDADKLLADRYAEAAESYKSDENLNWETDIVGTRCDEEVEGNNDILLTGEDALVLSVNVPVANAYDVFCYLPAGTVEGPMPQEHRSIAKYWYEHHGAELCMMGGDVLQYRVDRPVERDASEKLSLEHFAYCEDVFTQNDITIKEHEQLIEDSTVWFFWWD